MLNSLLFKHVVPVTDTVELSIPTIGEIMDYGEEKYFSNLSAFTAKPFTYMAMLDDIGLDYEKVTDFELFCYLVPMVDSDFIPFLFGETLSLTGLVPAMDNTKEELVLVNPEDTEETFTALELRIIASAIRQIHFFTEETHKAGNAAAKEYLIERAKKKAKRNKNKPYQPFLEPLIVALVNAPEFSYTYQSIEQITIYQFMCSVYQVPRRIQYDNIMHGAYVGMIDMSSIDKKDLNWLSPELRP